MSDSTWSGKATTKKPKVMPTHAVTSLIKQINQLGATSTPLHMASTELLTAANYSSKHWLPGIHQVRALPGWRPPRKMLIWVDNVNSWVRKDTSMPNVPVVTRECEEVKKFTKSYDQYHSGCMIDAGTAP